MTAETIARSLSVMTYLRRKGTVPLADLEDRFGLDREGMLALLEGLREIGVPPYGGGDYVQVVFEGDSVRLGATQNFQGPARLTLEEITALRLWLVATSAGDEPWRSVVRSLLEKVEDLAGHDAGLSMDIERLREVDRRSRTLTAVDEALREGRVLALEYFSVARDRLVRREVEAHGLIDRRGVWVLVARDRADGRVKHFRIDRVRTAELTGDIFVPPEDAALDEHLERPFMGADDLPRVRVRARGPLRDELGRIGTACVDDGDTVVGELAVDSVPWLVQWLLTHRELVELVDAGALAGEIRERLAGLKPVL